MLANKNSLKKLEKIFYLKNSIPIGKQPSIKIEGSLHSTSYPNNQNRKNFNLRSEKKLRLQEEFKTKEKDYFKLREMDTVKGIDSEISD